MAELSRVRKIKRIALFMAALFVIALVLLFSFFMYNRSHVSNDIWEITSSFEFNPVIREGVSGKWSGNNERLILAGDGTFTYQTADGHIESGTWKRDDWNLYLEGDGYSAGMRFVKLNGQYLILTHPPDFSQDETGRLLVDAIASALRREQHIEAPSAP